MKVKTYMKLYLVSFATLVVLSFQNCSPQFKPMSQMIGEEESASLAAPNISFVATPTLISSNNHQIQFSVDLPATQLRSVICRINSSPEYSCPNLSVNLVGLMDGDHTILVRVESLAGLQSEAALVIRKDATAPTLSVSTSPPAQTASTTAQFIFASTDSLSGVQRTECSFDSAAFAPCSSPHSVSNLAMGNHNMRIRALDLAGNMSEVFTHNWVVDMSTPTVLISSGPAQATNLSTASFVFSGIGVQTYQCQLNDAAYANCTSPFNLTNVPANRANTLRIRGTSGTGVMSSVVSYNWTHDSVVPTTPTFTSTAPATTNLRNQSISFSASDSGVGLARYECSTGGAYSTCTSPSAFSNLADGEHMLRVRAHDLAGNISAIGTFSWRVDTIAPSIAFSSMPPMNTTQTSLSFSFAATDAGSGVASLNCSLNMSAFANCSSPYVTAVLAVGNHSFRVRALDQAGNMTMITHNWTQVADSTAESRFASARGVIQRNCAGCHFPGSSPGNLSFQTEIEFVNAGLVSPGSLSGSKLIYRLRNYPVQVEGRTMPPVGPLTPADYAALESWVANISPSILPSNYFACGPDEAPEGLDNRRLTKLELQNTLRLLLARAFGQTQADQALLSNPAFFAGRVPNDGRLPFSKSDDSFSALHARAYFDLASDLSDYVVDPARYSTFVSTYINYDRGTCVISNVESLSQACRDAFIRNFLVRAWGRPVETDNTNLNNELASFQQEYTLASTSRQAIGNIVFKALVSPQFLTHLYIDVSTQSGNIHRLSSYAIARRLSFQYMRSGLDEGLLAIARTQDLNTDAGFQQAINYVSTRSGPMVREFADEWLKLYDLPIQSNTTHPKFVMVSSGINVNENLRSAMREEIIELVSYLNQNSRPVREMLTSNVSFARQTDLMRIYGQSAAAPQTVTEQNAVRFPASQRSGVLTRAGYLFGGSHTERPIIRGVHVRDQFLCRNVQGTAPPDATTTPLPTDDTMTTREKTQHITGSTNCVGCHSQINPVGFAFSQFNTLGAFQTDEPIFDANNNFSRNLPVNASVDLSVAMGLATTSNSAIQFSEIVADSRDFKRCISQQYYTYLNGLRAKSTEQNSCSMSRMYQVVDSNGTLNEFFRSAAQDANFRRRSIVRN